MAESQRVSDYRNLDEITLADIEAIRLLLRGGSVIDWHRLNFETPDDVYEFLRVQELDMNRDEDRARVEMVKREAIGYLRRNFDFPIPKPVEEADMAKLIEIACTKGHRQLCACTILKVVHIIHHLEARELLYLLPVSDQEVFHLVEQKVYRVIGGMLARGLPIIEFVGGRKNKDSLYTKLLSKQETIAAQIYDKLRFRIVTRTSDDIFPTLGYLTRFVFPFNYVIPGQSTNTMFHFRSYCAKKRHVAELLPRLQHPDFEDELSDVDNRFTDRNYRVVHFVVDMPVRVPDELLRDAPKAARHLGAVIFVQTEFQVIDRETEHQNELGAASHHAYKERQKKAVMRRLKLGSTAAPVKREREAFPAPPPTKRISKLPKRPR